MNNKRLILAKDSNVKYSKGILDVLGNRRRKLAASLGAISIISSMLFTSGCSKENNQGDAYKSETSTVTEETLLEEKLEEFDPNKCEIEEEHTHECIWEEMRTYPDQGEILTKCHQWCKDEEIEELRTEHSDSNFKVTGKYSIASEETRPTILRATLSEEQLEEFDPNKCEIEGEHYHEYTYVITIKDLDGTTKYEYGVGHCKDEDIERLKSKHQNHDYKITENYLVIVSTPVANKTLTKK